MYWEIEPEVAGDIGANTVLDSSVHPQVVHHLHYDFDGWLGSELVTSFPCFLVTYRLGKAIEEAACTGCVFASVEVTLDKQFVARRSDIQFPTFVWMKVTGRAGKDDFGMSSDQSLVISDKARAIVTSHTLVDCNISPYFPSADDGTHNER